MMPELRFALAGLALAIPALAQEVRVRELERRLESVPAATAEWYVVVADLVEAQLDVDSAVALATASDAWQQARQEQVPGAAQAMAAMAELATTRYEGPTASKVWSNRTEGLPADSLPALQAHYHVARARSLCAAGLHVEELAHAIPGQTAAEQSGDPLLQLRAFDITLHVTPNHNLPSLRRRFEQARAGPHGAQVATFEPWMLLDEFLHEVAKGSAATAHTILDQAEAAARRDGNARALGTTLHCRGRLHALTEPERALDYYEQASGLLDEVGDRQAFLNTLDIRAWVTSRTGDLDRARELLAEAEAGAAGRGFPSVEDALLITQIEVAVRGEQGELAARLTRERDRRRASQVAADERVRAAWNRLASSEAQAAQAAAVLAAEHQELQEKSRRYRTWAAIGAIAFLMLLVGVSWGGRRRLQRANARLADEVERGHAARLEQTRLEEQLRALERAQGLGTMAAGVAHDFNNLLTGIVGNAELIAESSRGSETAVLASEIRQSGRHAARLCRQLQTYAGGAPIAPAPIDLVAAVRSLLPVLRSACGDQMQIRLVTDVESMGVVADAAALDQALLNLATNARDAKAHTVTIRIARPAPAGAAGAARVCIEIVDDGEGMPPQIAARVFDPFFTTRFPGRGLGLAVVSGIVQRHGGTISVRSEPGRGSTFRLELPWAQPPARVEPPVVLPSLPPASRAATVLAVDDDENVRTILARMLRSLGREATTFADGEALLAAATDAPTDRPLLLFVDLTMPDVDGTEVLRRARERRPDARVVLMSGHAEAYLGQVASDLRPDRVLAKPFHLDTLQRLLDELLSPPEVATRA